MSEGPSGLTRRRFLQQVGLAGGASAVYETMVTLGMLPGASAYPGPPKLPNVSGDGRSVLVLGAGVGGLTAAYELLKAGYEVRLLEASYRPGGRSFTVRRGDVIEQIGRRDQVCRFDEGLYLNAGPGRIPYHHQALLDYCRELDVALEVYVMENRANLFQTEAAFEGDAMVNRRIANDTRGYISELLAKAINKKALDEELSPEDRAALLDLLVVFGQLHADEDYAYHGSSRSGYVIQPGVVTPGVIEPPLPLRQLLDADFWNHRFYQPEEYEWQPTLFEPVGGMDKIVQAFRARVNDRRIHYRAVVEEIDNGSDGVTVRFHDCGDDSHCELRADYCISTIPLHLLSGIIAGNDSFDSGYLAAVADAPPFAETCKVGWQAEERFWQFPPDRQLGTYGQIYGGISWIVHPITQMWYPSTDYFAQKGVLTGTYNYGQTAADFGALPLEQRLDLAEQGALRLHPDFDKYVDKRLGLSIAWHQVEHLRGGWADWDHTDPAHQRSYERLLRPDKRFHAAGSQLSYWTGWQEGAVLSAHHVVQQIAGLDVHIPEIVRAPAARALVGADPRRPSARKRPRQQ